MICQRCLLRQARATSQSTSTSILACVPSASTPALRAQQRPLTTLAAQSTPPAETPTPETPASTATPSARNPPTPKPAPAKPLSSCIAGTPLRGLNYFKNKPDPVALEDSEYPDWLWRVLGDNAAGSDGAAKGKGKESLEGVEAMLYAKSATTRRTARKRLRAYEKQNPDSGVQRVPLHEQSVDLPVNDPLEALEAREELTHALRKQRRNAIKERNFLKGIR